MNYKLFSSENHGRTLPRKVSPVPLRSTHEEEEKDEENLRREQREREREKGMNKKEESGQECVYT